MNLGLFLMVVAVTLAIGILAATLVSPVYIITPVMAQNMTVLNMTAGNDCWKHIRCSHGY
jgi:opacity protein-like surface antigen